MKQVFIFIYKKDKDFKVLSIEDARRLDAQLKTDGWKHTDTLEACKFIENLLKERAIKL
jgi:hypothetical protein